MSALFVLSAIHLASAGTVKNLISNQNARIVPEVTGYLRGAVRSVRVQRPKRNRPPKLKHRLPTIPSSSASLTPSLQPATALLLGVQRIQRSTTLSVPPAQISTSIEGIARALYEQMSREGIAKYNPSPFKPHPWLGMLEF